MSAEIALVVVAVVDVVVTARRCRQESLCRIWGERLVDWWWWLWWWVGLRMDSGFGLAGRMWVPSERAMRGEYENGQ